MTRKRLFLSPPDMSGRELPLVKEAFASNWIAPLGPHVDMFEEEFASMVGAKHAAALSSGTAALHLALRSLSLAPGDEVYCSSLTFSASANPIIYEGATPVFIDSDPGTWNMDPALLATAIDDGVKRGKRPKAVVLVHLYGQSADIDPVAKLCRSYDIPLIEDAAESLGATYNERSPGTYGRCGVFSFNGNKIITTSGGGMLVSEDEMLIRKIRFWATQARDPAPHYQHSEIGFNYRMSNVLAAIGRGQLQVLPDRVNSRRRVFELYRARLEGLPGLQFMPEAHYGRASRWLTCITIDPQAASTDRERVRLALENENIESRPVWKPMHLQPVFAGCKVYGGRVAERLFEHGLCLPSGSRLSESEIDRVSDVICREFIGG